MRTVLPHLVDELSSDQFKMLGVDACALHKLAFRACPQLFPRVSIVESSVDQLEAIQIKQPGRVEAFPLVAREFPSTRLLGSLDGSVFESDRHGQSSLNKGGGDRERRFGRGQRGHTFVFAIHQDGAILSFCWFAEDEKPTA